MSKHTPGPWEIYKDKFVPTEMAPGSKMYVIQTADDHRDHVGFACSWCDNPETLLEARANANLIAAAPDLLKMLVYLFPRAADRLSIIEEILVKDLIAKARGEA